MDDSRASQKRRRKLIDPKAQLKICALFATIGIVMVGLQAVVLHAMLSEAAVTLPNDGLILGDQVARLTWTSFAIAAFLIVPTTLLVGVQVTFRFAGPMFRFREFLQRVVSGKETEPCRIRSEDMLQDFCTLLNEATAAQRDRNASGSPRRDREPRHAKEAVGSSS